MEPHASSDTTATGRAPVPPSPSNAPKDGVRARADRLVEHKLVQRTIVVVILVNAAVLGLLTTPWGRGPGHELLIALDVACLVVFVVEILLKLFAKGSRFFRSGWNVFDLLVVAVALIPEGGGFAVLRTLRILRLVSLVKRLRFVVEALAGAIPGLASIGTLLVILYYVGAVMATSLFGERFPEWFGNVGASAFSLFQVMTLDSWSTGLVRPIMDVYPWAPWFFIPFILLAAFTVLNLFVAVIVDSMQNLRENPDAWPDEPEREKAAVDTHDQIVELRGQVTGLQADLTEALTLLKERRAEQTGD